MTVSHFFNPLIIILDSKQLLLVVQTASFLFKASVFYFFVRRILQTASMPKSWIYLLTVIIGSAMEDFAWIVSLSHKLIFYTYSYTPVLTYIRISWAFHIITYQALALFIQSFKKRASKLPFVHYIFIAVSLVFFATLSLYCFKTTVGYTDQEIFLREIESIYILLVLMPATIISALYTLQQTDLPKILRLQLKTCLQFFLIPHLVATLYQVYPFKFTIGTLVNHPATVGISTVFLSLTIYHCMKKIIGLRFLDLHNHVQDHQGFNFIDDFRTILEELGNASNTKEITLLAQHFFNKALGIANHHVALFVRTVNQPLYTEQEPPISSPVNTTIENFIGIHNGVDGLPKPLEYLKNDKIFIYDEIAYNHFHNPTEITEAILEFLDVINASIFLPVYENGVIIAYITVNKNSRNGDLYTNVERDEMIVFASYLSKVINLLQNRNLHELLKQRKEIVEELYVKHQETSRYRESIRSFLRTNRENNIGIMFYKNRKFNFGNKVAAEMIGVNPNTQEGDPITKVLKSIGHQVSTYRTSQTKMVKNPQGTRIIISASPHPEHHGAVITVHYPEISDVIKRLLDQVKDPSNWDYLLYLETTESGRLINELVPGSGDTFLNFKIDLLKLALSKKAILLDLPEDDLIATVELLHHVSLRETMHVFTVHAPVDTSEVPVALFGINPLFGSNTSQPLLEKLNKKGTLFIKNIHFLDLETQENLAEFIRYGFYRVFKSDKKVQSDVRVIASSSHNLAQLVEEGTFSQALFNELRHSTLTLPSLLTINPNEVETLVDGYSEQALTDNICNKLLTLSDKEKMRIAAQKPVSLQELKRRVQNKMIEKSKKTEVYEETEFNPAYNISDPRLAEAARLGKYALKDKQVMSLLWDKFKNQNKIATFLGVNRSSVHRRCKDYGLL